MNLSGLVRQQVADDGDRAARTKLLTERNDRVARGII